MLTSHDASAEPIGFAIYCRISDDAEKRGLGVRRQEDDCRALVARLGGVVNEVYVDNDITAADPSVHRPAFDRLCSDLYAGEHGGLAIYEQLRLVREPTELEDLIVLATVTEVQVQTVVAGELKLAVLEGQLLARVTGALGKHEAEVAKRRTQRTMLARAQAGEIASGEAGFGYMPDKLTINEDEEALILEAYDRLFAGVSLKEIARDWTARGIPTKRGGKWHGASIRRIVMAPRIAGFREHRGRIAAPAVWPAIVDEMSYHRMVKLLSEPSRTKGTRRIPRLLTGLVMCGNCGEGMNSKTGRPDNPARRYFCRHCRKRSILAEPLEVLVAQVVIDALDGAAVEAALAAAPKDELAALLAKVAGIEARKQEARRMFATGDLSIAEYGDLQRLLNAEEKTHKLALDQLQTASAGEWAGRGAELRAQWPDMDDRQRRQALRTILAAVRIGPATPGRQGFDAGRVSFDWRF